MKYLRGRTVVFVFLLVYLRTSEGYLGCYSIDKENRVYGVSPGNYDPTSLTVDACTGACGDIGYKYSSVEAGSFCFCSDSNYKAVSKESDDTKCNIACSGGGGNCGSHTHGQAYESTTPLSIFLDKSDNIFTVFSPKSVTVHNATGTALEYSFNYGDGSGDTPYQTSQTFNYAYSLPGEYIITAAADNAFMSPAYDAIRAYAMMPVGRASVECIPPAVEPGMETRCITTVIEGSDMTLSMDLETATVSEFNIADPLLFAFGYAVPQYKVSTVQNGGTLLGGNNDVWIIPEAEVTEYGRLLAWELYISDVGDGGIDLLIFRPNCDNTPSTPYCAKTNLCEASCAGVWNQDANPLYQDICAANEVFCLSRKRCVPRDNPDTCDIEPQRHVYSGDSPEDPMTDYSVAWVHTISISSTGYNLVKLDSFSDVELFRVDVGDKLGFRARTGGAQIGFYKVASGEVIEFTYNNIASTPTVGTLYRKGSGASSAKRHLVRAITSDPSLALVRQTYNTPGQYKVTSTIKNNLNSPNGLTVSTIVYVEEPIEGLEMEVDKDLIHGSEDVFVKARVSAGLPVNYTWSWGDGLEETTVRSATNYSHYDEMVHNFVEDGHITITVNASNNLNTLSATYDVDVQYPILRNYLFSHNSAVFPATCVYTITYDNPGNVDYPPTDVSFMVVFGDYENSSLIPLGLLNHGDVNNVVDHEFRFPDEYTGKVIMYNLVSYEEFEVVGGSYEIITSLGLSASYIPPTSNDDTEESGFGPGNIFPEDSPVIFEGTHDSGTTVTYRYTSFDDGTAVEETTQKKHPHKFNGVGTYNVQMEALNAVTAPSSTSMSIEIRANIKGISITEGSQTSANELKSFTVDVTHIGTDSCIAIDFGDGTQYELYGDQPTCVGHATYGSGNYISTLSTSLALTHTYTSTGTFKFVAHGFNLVSFYDAYLDFAVSDVDCSSPTLSVRDGHPYWQGPRAVYRSTTILLQTITELNCAMTRKNSKKWSYVEIDPNTGENVGSVVDLTSLPVNDPKYLSDAHTAEIAIPSYYLPIGTYKFTCYVEMDSSATNGDVFWGMVDEYVEVKPAGLNVKVLESDATRMEIGWGQQLVLNPGKFSKDLDVPPTAPNDFDSVMYFCRQVYEPWPLTDDRELDTVNHVGTCSGNYSSPVEPIDYGGCCNGGPGRLDYDTGELALDTTYMTENVTHELMVIVTKGAQTGNYTMFITVTTGTPPQMSLDCAPGSECFSAHGGRKINPTTDLRLHGRCTQDCDAALTYDWDIEFYNETSELYEPIPNWRVYATGSSTQYLYIKKEFFIDNSDWSRYSISLTGTRAGGTSGSSFMTVYVNTPPYGGTCTATPGDGVASIDPFNVHCQNWKDEDGIDSYQFYSVFVNDTIQKQITFGREPSVAMFPPLGPQANSYFQELWVSIYDTVGARTSVMVQEIQVRPPDESVAGDIMDTMFNKTMGNLQQYADLAASENTREINKQVLIDASLLNALRESDRDEYESEYGTYSTTTAGATPQATESFVSKELDRNRRGYLRSILLRTMKSSSLDSIEDLKLISSTTYMATSATDELSPSALESTVELASSMASKITEMVSTTSQTMIEEAGAGMIATLGNCLQGLHDTIANPLLIVDEFEQTGQTGTEAFENTYQSSIGTVTEWLASPTDNLMTSTPGDLSDKELKAKQIVQQAENALNMINRALLKNKVPGETATTISTPSISLQLRRNNPSEIANRTYDIGDGQFSLPEWCSMKNSPGQDCTEDKVVDMELYSLKKNPYIFNGENSQRVSIDSHAMILNYRNLSGEEMQIQNTAKAIGIIVPRPSSPDPETTYYSSQPLEGDGMVYHNFNVSDIDEDTSIIIDLLPDDLSVQYAVYIRYAERPTTNYYDHVFVVPSDMSLAGQTSLSPSPYRISIGDTYVGKNTGKYVIGVIELDRANYKYSQFIRNQKAEVPAMEEFISNYSMSISSSGCLYWSVVDERWSSDGCSVGPKTNQYQTECLCTHLTNFASAWVIPPNDIDFDYVFANMDFAKNPTIYVVVIVVFVFYFIGLIWCRRKDNRDIALIGVAPLPDNDPNDKYLYEVVVLTGRRKNGGTDSKVSFILSGEDDETEVRMLADDKRKILRRSGVDSFLMAVPRPLGTLNYMRIWHDNSGKGKMQSWYLSYIAFRDLQTGERFYFIANRWFSVVEDDGQIDRLVPVAGKEQMQGFDHVFSSTTRKNFDDGHLWFSVIARPPRSRFTRCQRLSCCMMALWLEMLVNIMWYGITPPTSSNSPLNFGPFSLSPAQISIGVQSNLIVFPISLLVIQIFRKARPKKKRKSRIEIAKEQLAQKRQKNNYIDRSAMVSPSHVEVKQNNDQMYLLDFEEKEDTESKYTNLDKSDPDKFMSIDAMIASEDAREKKKKEKRRKKKKKSFGFPHWCIYIGWVLVFLSIATAATFVIFYAVQMGDLETKQWFTSLVISFLTAILLTQPIKVILIGLFIALVLKTPNADEDEDAEEDEEDYELNDDEEWLHAKPLAPIKERKLAYKPPDEKELSKAREQRMKEIKMYSIIREIIFYMVFLWLLLIISYGNRDPNSFNYMEHLSTLFIKDDPYNDYMKVTSRHRFWNYAHEIFVPALFVQDWYNGDPPDDDLTGFLNDRYSRIMGHVVVRQLRIHPGQCSLNEKFSQIVDECNVGYSMSNQDQDSYGRSWRHLGENETATIPEYIYTPASDLDGYPFLGRHGLYSGGGYVARLLGSESEVHDLLYRLEAENWIDDYTKAIFIEFSTYNAQVNLFGVVILLLEITKLGAALPLYRIDPVKLLSYFSGFALFQVVCEGLFLTFVVFFLIKEINNIRQQKKKYIKSFWNIIEFSIVSLSIAAIVLYFYRFIVSNKLSATFRDSGGAGYIKLQYVAYWNELLGYLLGIIVFLSNLKFLKLLRFNKRMSLLSSTLKSASADILHYFIMFGIIFASFAMAFYLVFAKKVFDFADFIYTLESLFATMLGKFRWHAMKDADSVMAPLLFFFFILSVTFILVNMFLTILNENFSEVKRNTAKQANEFEMVEFMMSRFKLWTGIGESKARTASPLIPNNKVNPKDITLKEENVIDAFPDKVDQLLDSITKMYFNPSSKENLDFLGSKYDPKQMYLKESNINQDKGFMAHYK